MKTKETNIFKFKLSRSIINGYFNIYQARNGSIQLMMGTNNITLSIRQLEKLKLCFHELINFNYDSYLEFYKEASK